MRWLLTEVDGRLHVLRVAFSGIRSLVCQLDKELDGSQGQCDLIEEERNSVLGIKFVSFTPQLRDEYN